MNTRTNEPRIVGRHPRQVPPTVTTRPHTTFITGVGPQFDVHLDSGSHEPLHIVTITRDMAYILRNQLDKKLGETL